MRDESSVPDGNHAAIPAERVQGNDAETSPSALGSQLEMLQAVHVETIDDTHVIAAPEAILGEVRRRLPYLPSTELRPLVITVELYRELSRLRFFLRRNGRIVYRKPRDRTSGWCARFRLPRQNTDVFYDLPVVDTEQARVAEMIVRNWRPRRRRRHGPHTSIHIRMNDQLFARRHRDCTDGIGGQREEEEGR